jgi:purine nucleoside permease
VASFGEDGLAPIPAEVTAERVVVTLVFSGKLPPWVTGMTFARSEAVGYPGPAVGCDLELPTCELAANHAGTAHAELSAQLVSVTFEESEEAA